MLIRNDHDGPGVVPGRYPGEAIQLHDGPTPESIADEEQRAHADALAGRICAAAAEATRSQYLLLELLGEFDATNSMRHWTGFKSLAHWLSWCCSMTPGVARELFRTFPRERLSRRRRSVTLTAWVRLSRLPPRSTPATIQCSVPLWTSMARCWRWAGANAWLVKRNAGRC